MNTDITRSMPYSLEAENGLLSCLLQNPADLIAASIHTLDIDAFYHPANRRIYEILRQFHRDCRPVDLVSLSHFLIDGGEMDKIGGPATLADLYSFVPTPAHYGYYRGILKDKHLLRRIIIACNETVQAAYALAPTEAASTVLEQFEEKVIDLRKSEKSEKCRPISQLVDDALTRYEQAILNGGQLPGISTGYRRLDAATGGMRAGQVWTIGGGTSDGKSAFMQNIVASLGQRRVPTCLYTLEMSDDDNIDRFFCIESCIPGQDYLYGLTNRDKMKDASEAAKELRQWPVDIVDVSGIKLSALRADMRLRSRRSGVKVFALDYLQLVSPDAKDHNREREVAQISAAMKTEAKLLNATVINLSQLNDDGKLRESRAVGMDSDVVCILQSLSDEKKKKIKDRRRLFLGKQRQAESDVCIDYNFHGPTFRFIEQ